MITVPVANEFPEFVVVAVNAEYAPSPAITPATPTTVSDRRILCSLVSFIGVLPNESHSRFEVPSCLTYRPFRDPRTPRKGGWELTPMKRGQSPTTFAG